MECIQEPCVLCLGFFDGVHLGHQALIRAARELADRNGLIVCVHSYRVSPYEVITGQKAELLTENEEKERLLRSFGADRVIFSPFDRTVMKVPGKVFFEQVLLRIFDPKIIVAGLDHRFGYQGDTDTTVLQSLCDQHGISLVLIPPVLDEAGERISSSIIRQCLREGRINEAKQMLGHRYIKQGRDAL